MAGAMVGSLLGVSSLLTSVWFAPDHGTVWLFFVGFVACLWTIPNDGMGLDDGADVEEREDPPVDEGAEVRQPRRMLAHAPKRPLPVI